jgi:hypothetical protein
MVGNSDIQRAWPILPLAPTGNIEVTSSLFPEKFALSQKCSTHVTSMLPLSRRGNAPQTLCHRPFPSIILPRYLILRNSSSERFSPFFISFLARFKDYYYLCKCYLPMVAAMFSKGMEPQGGALHCGKATLYALFLSCLNYHNQISIKDNCRSDAYGCVYQRNRSVLRAYYAFMHTFGGIVYIPPGGIKSVRSIEMAVVGQNSRTGSS